MNTKKMAKRLKDSGVSPVIATILMVAITVVLAAVLYVMVSGFTHSPGTANSAGLSVSTNSAGNWVVTIDKVSSPNIANSSIKVVIGSSTYTITAAAGGGTLGSSTGITFTNVGGTADLAAGDYFTIPSASASAGTTFQIVDGNSILASITLQ